MHPHIKVRKSLINRVLRACNENYDDMNKPFLCLFYDPETFRHYDKLIFARSANEAIKLLFKTRGFKQLYKIIEQPAIKEYEFNNVYSKLVA